MILALRESLRSASDCTSLKTHGLAAQAALWLPRGSGKLWLSAALTTCFAVLGRLVRGVTTAGAVAGALACLALFQGLGTGGFSALLMVFALTWLATRIGYRRKQQLGTAEPRTGRGALQVLANLGMASVCAFAYATIWPDRRLAIAACATLAEAAADTVSSEIGQAAGGIPRLVTTWRKAAPGTDGAVSFAGTLAGTAAAVIVGLTCVVTGLLPWHSFPICAGAAVIGMLADSFLGATFERKGLLGNNAVNFISTAIAAAAAFLLS